MQINDDGDFDDYSPDDKQHDGDALRVHIPQLQFKQVLEAQTRQHNTRQQHQFPTFDVSQDLERSNKLMIQEHLMSNMNESMFSITDTNQNTGRQITSKLTHLQSSIKSLQDSGSLNDQLSLMKSDLMRVQQDNNDIQKRISGKKPILVHDYLYEQQRSTTKPIFSVGTPVKQQQPKTTKHKDSKEKNYELHRLSEQYESQKSELHVMLESKNQQLRNEKEIYQQLKQGFEASIKEVKQMQGHVSQVQREKQDLNQRLMLATKQDNQTADLKQQLLHQMEQNKKLLIQIDQLHESQDRSKKEQNQAGFRKEQMVIEVESQKERLSYSKDRLQNLASEIKCLESIVVDKDLYIKNMESTLKAENTKLESKITYYENVIKNMQKQQPQVYQMQEYDQNLQVLNQNQQQYRDSRQQRPSSTQNANQQTNQEQREAQRCLLGILDAKDSKIIQLNQKVKQLNDLIHNNENYPTKTEYQPYAAYRDGDYAHVKEQNSSMNHSNYFDTNSQLKHRRVNSVAQNTSILNYDLPVRLLQCLKQ